jgi:creatinine amidohydrolase
MTLVASLTWDEVERRIAKGALAILPIGAAAKEHGWHLPMQTDQLQAEWLSLKLAETFDALIWPTLTYGYYPAFVNYAGSASLSAATFEAVVRELATALVGFGTRLIIVNTGISTIAPVDKALAQLGDARRMLHVKIHAGGAYRDAAAKLAEQTHGGHADDLETSRLLAIVPQSVKMDRAVASPKKPPGPGPMQHTDPDQPNYSRAGSIGDPTKATRAKGEALLEAMMQDVIAAVEAWI